MLFIQTRFGFWRGTATTIPLNQWSFVVGVYDSQNRTIDTYFNGNLDDGSLVGTVPSSIPVSGLDVNIGNRPGVNPPAFDFCGKLDEAFIYNRALTATQIKAMYDATK